MNQLFRFTPVLASVLLLCPSPAVAADASFVIGGGVAAGQRYSGADQNSVAPVILLDYSNGGFFASSMRGLGYGAQAGPFSYSAALGYRGERKERNKKGLFGNSGSDDLRGMGDIKGNASALLGLAYTLLPGVELSLNADLPLSQKDNGSTVHAGISGQLLSLSNDTVTLALTAAFGDAKYNQTYYGVSARQAGQSNFNAYRAGAGLYEINAALSWEHKFDARWSLTTVFGATRLVNDAARSPLVRRRTAPGGALYVSYVY